jgi:hypothetical protein
MRVPPVSERVKEAPAQALRAVFAGIGQLLLVTDRIRNRAAGQDDVPHPRQPEDETATAETAAQADAAAAAETAAAAEAAAPAETAQAEAAPAETMVDESPKAEPQGEQRVPRTGNVRLLTEADAAESTEAADAAAETVLEAPAAKKTPKPAAAKAAPKATAAKAAPKAPPAKAAPEATAAGAVPEAPASAAAAGEPLPSYSELSIASIRARLRNLSVDQVRELVVYEKAHAARADFITTFERRIIKLESEES